MPLSDVVASAAAIIQPLVAAKHQTLDVRLGAPETLVLVDRLRFEQVLINLLSNAQRYSPAGGHIVVSSRTEGGEVIISVRDSGPGVAAQDREVIFEPFYRGDRSGLGLGLAIAKSLVELHSGRIWVESAGDGQGSIFCVALPAHDPAAERPLASRAASQ
ncbi:MAG: ATP-binding protein [Chloroflexi bacterium]|nr:ATP-binding protein [Chloroflexota bacterium]